MSTLRAQTLDPDDEMKYPSAATLSLLILLALALFGCGDEQRDGPACSYPGELPVTVDLPDGGDLRLFQTANSNISGDERDRYIVDAYCVPDWGYSVAVRIEGDSDMDVAYSIFAIGQYFETDYQGPGGGEGATLVTAYFDPGVPFQITIEVWSVNGETGAYSISINPDPLPT